MVHPEAIAIVLEADPFDAHAIRAYLETLNFMVISFSDHRLFMREVDDMKCSASLLLTDADLDRSTRYEDVVERVRLRCGNIPAIVLTGEAWESAEERAKAANCYCMSKPISPRRLYEIINALTEHGALESGKAL